MELKHYGLNVEELARIQGKHKSCFDNPGKLRPYCGNGSFHAATTRSEKDVTCAACYAKLAYQNGTHVTGPGGDVRMRSKNLRALVRYAAVSPLVAVKAHPCPKNPYNGKLYISYADGSTSAAHFASHVVLLEWLRHRRTWRGPGIDWDIVAPDTPSERGTVALEYLARKGVYHA